MNVKKTKAWKAAEYEYSEMIAQSIVPFKDFQLSPDEIIERFEGIVHDCPTFYPAHLESGLRQLALGREGAGKQKIDEGIRLMLELAEPQDIDEELDALFDNLEKLWRFDLSRHYLDILIEHYPNNSLLRDNLAHAAARMGDIDKALLAIGKALEIEPNNPHFMSNKGWIHLIAGNLQEAQAALAEAFRLAPDNEVVSGNLEIHQYLTDHGGNYLDYLLRPPDREEIDRLADEEEWEKVDQLCASYNGSRIEAMAQAILREEECKRLRLPDLLSTLRQFFRFVDDVDSSGYFLYEDLPFIHENFKVIMHKFIFKFYDIDDHMIEEIYESLLEYYGFLSKHKLASVKNFRLFKKDILGIKQELIDKMERYNMIRYDDELDEDEKEAIREELFEGDHAWSFF